MESVTESEERRWSEVSVGDNEYDDTEELGEGGVAWKSGKN